MAKILTRGEVLLLRNAERLLKEIASDHTRTIVWANEPDSTYTPDGTVGGLSAGRLIQAIDTAGDAVFDVFNLALNHCSCEYTKQYRFPY